MALSALASCFSMTGKIIQYLVSNYSFVEKYFYEKNLLVMAPIHDDIFHCLQVLLIFRVSPATCLYTAMHGCYGFLWLAKEVLYR